MDKTLRRTQSFQAGDPPCPEAGQAADTSRCIREGVIAMTIAMLVLLVFNSSGLRMWARNLPGNAASDVLVEYADRWHGIMRNIGATVPKAAVQSAVADFRDYDWSDAAGLRVTAGHDQGGKPEG